MPPKNAILETTAISRPRAPDMIPGYRLEKLVGKGGMGEVHRAIQLSLGRTVAVKLLSPELAKDPSFVARFEKEAAALAALSHPHIVSIVEKGKTASTYYLVMEFVDGPSLREVMRSPLLDPLSSLKMALEICRAIDYAHNRGIIHRDLKPENILFDEQAGGIAKVTDFGLAAFADPDSSSTPGPGGFNMTETHVSMGTLSYMAPEQRVDAKSADHRADIYTLGVILYELLVGEIPVGSYDAPSDRNPELDKRLDDIVARCLKPMPADRFQKLSELIADLEPLVPVSFSQIPREVSKLDRLKMRVRRAVTRAGRIAALSLVVWATGIVGLAMWRHQHRPPPRGLAGEAMASVVDPQGILTVPGRLDESVLQRWVTFLGEGPDKVALVARGRPVLTDPKARVLSFGEGAEDSTPGHAYLDVGKQGEAITFEADVLTRPQHTGFFGTLKSLISGHSPDAQTALLLMGDPGRYVAIVLTGPAGAAALEWALGEKRGTTLGANSGREGTPTHVELLIDRDGELRAFAGSDKDRRQVGEPVSLGTDWRAHFGRTPRAAIGCLDGDCQFTRVQLAVARQGRAPPPPPVLTSPEPAAGAPASPALSPPTKSAVAQKGKGGTRKVSTASAAKKRSRGVSSKKSRHAR
ncbi:MAG: serine/threonine-protein kinase [Myxococcaceae bacterium]